MIFRTVLSQGKFSFGPPFGLHQFRCGIGRWLFAKMLLHPEMDRHNYSNDGYGAEHQNRKQNLDHHRESGYQNRQRENVISRHRRRYRSE